jgi:hypothetical protein
MGRWVSCDPLPTGEQRKGGNLFGYCHSDPIGAIDPDGRDVVVLKESQLTAQDFVTMLKNQKSIPEGIRNAVSINKKDSSRIQFSGAPRRYSSKGEAELWDPLYKELQRAASSDRFALTTGKMVRVPTDSELPSSTLTADVPPGIVGMKGPEGFQELHGGTLNLPAKADMAGIVVPSLHEAASLGAEGRAYTGSRVVSDLLPGKRSLIVVANRLSAGANQAPIDARLIVHTLFHELALHASGIAGEKVDIAHGTERVDTLERLLNRLVPEVDLPDVSFGPPPADAGVATPLPKPADAGTIRKEREQRLVPVVPLR